MISISKCSWPFGGKHDFCIFDNSLFLFQIQIYCTCVLIFNNDIFNNVNMAYYLSKFFILVNLNARKLSVSKMLGNILIINIRMSLSIYPNIQNIGEYVDNGHSPRILLVHVHIVYMLSVIHAHIQNGSTVDSTQLYFYSVLNNTFILMICVRFGFFNPIESVFKYFFLYQPSFLLFFD